MFVRRLNKTKLCNFRFYGISELPIEDLTSTACNVCKNYLNGDTSQDVIVTEGKTKRITKASLLLNFPSEIQNSKKKVKRIYLAIRTHLPWERINKLKQNINGVRQNKVRTNNSIIHTKHNVNIVTSVHNIELYVIN